MNAAGRYFFALQPPVAQRRALAEGARAALEATGGRAVPLDNLHVTLAFIGAGDPTRLSRAAGRVSGRRIVLTLDGLSYPRRRRMLWAECAVLPAALEHLVNDLRGELKAASVSFDAKPFRAHVTLARHAHGTLGEHTLSPVRWTCDGFDLFASRPVPGGVRYEWCGRWALASGRP